MIVKSPKIIAVDLTPVLPGGENGGAKVFTLALIRTLAARAPQTQFVLLIQSAAAQELQTLEQKNVRCCVVRHSVTSVKSGIRNRGAITRLWAVLPMGLKTVFFKIGYPLYRALKRAQAQAQLQGLQADLLFCPFTEPTYFKRGIPTVCTLYDLQHKMYPEFFSPAEILHRDRVFRDVCQYATAIATISDYSKQSVLAHAKQVPRLVQTVYLRMADRLQVGSFMDPTSSMDPICQQYDLNPELYLIYPANFWPHKNHEKLLIAFDLACKNGLPDNIKLICTGSPNARRECLMQQRDQLECKNRVIFPGYLSQADFAALLRNSGGMIFPSLYEGFGLPVIEAMAAGVPVACSNRTSLPEIAGEAALLFDPSKSEDMAKALIRLMEDKTLRAQNSEAGKKRAQIFADQEHMAREYWDLFQKIM